MTPPHISPLFNHQKQSKVTFAIRCTNQKHLYLYTSATYALFSNILPEKACFLLRIFVSLHRQSKEQSFVPRSSLLLRPTRVINDGRRRSSMKTPKTAETGRSGEFEPTRLVSYRHTTKKAPDAEKHREPS